MSRDLDLVRLILLKIEGTEPVDLSGYSDDEADRVLEKMEDAGLVKMGVVPSAAFASAEDYLSEVRPRITLLGHSFLLGTKSPPIWKAALAKVGSAAGSAALSVGVEYVKSEARRAGYVS